MSIHLLNAVNGFKSSYKFFVMPSDLFTCFSFLESIAHDLKNFHFPSQGLILQNLLIFFN